MPERKIMRAAAYCRVSTEREEQINSLNSQCLYFEEYINTHKDYELVEIYYDEGVSGTSVKNRYGFNRMIDDAFSGKIDIILTKDISRFSRHTKTVLEYAQKLKKIKVGVLFVNDNINTLKDEDEFKLSIMAGVAQEESRKISERVKWGQRRRMEQGVVFGRNLLGYDVKDGKLSVNPEGAEVVKLIFHKYVNERKGTHVIARELKEDGFRPMRVKEWTNTVILRVLRNEKYVGDLCQQKTYTPDYKDHCKKYNRGELDMVYIENHHEPIIERSVWNKAQEILAERTLTDEQKSRHSCRYWCSGKLICGECGSRFVSRTKKLMDGSIYKAWRCVKAAKHGSRKTDFNNEIIGCNNISVNEKVLINATGYVLNLMKVNKKELISEMKKEISNVYSNLAAPDIKSLEKELDKIFKSKSILLDRFLEGVVKEKDYKIKNNEYDEKAEELRAKIRNKENAFADAKRQARKMQDCIDYVKQYLDFENADEHLCGEVLESITVFSNGVLEIKLKYAPGVRLKYTVSGRKENYKAVFRII